MNIKTRYNISDNVFVLNDNTIVPVTIREIKYTLRALGENISYGVSITTSDGYKKFPENKIFKTKKELLKSL